MSKRSGLRRTESGNTGIATIDASTAGTACIKNNSRQPKLSISGPPATTASTGDIASTAVYSPMAFDRWLAGNVAAMRPNAAVAVAAPDI